MAWNKPTTISRARELRTLEAISADPLLGPHVRNIFPLTGQLIKTPRKKVERLGQGSFGRVNLEAYSEGNVATKYVTGELNENIVDAIGEVVAMKYLYGLPNIIPLISLEFTQPNTYPLNFPAMVTGKAQSDLYKAKFTNWNTLYSTVIQVLRGYYTLHSMKIVHRDTKPMNMLITSYGEVWIADFGKARYIHTHLTPPDDNYPGTYWYASPEALMKASGHDDRTPLNYFKNDAWAVGASLYHILTNMPFYRGYTEVECIKALFLRKGTPVPSDGEVYTLYESWFNKSNIDAAIEEKTGNKVVAQRSDKVINSILALIRTPDADATQLSQIAKIVSGLMEYDIAKRLTITEALQMVGLPGLPPPLSPPSISGQATELSDYPNDITSASIENFFSWLYPYIKHNNKGDTFPIVLDVTGLYIYTFLQKYREEPFCNQANLKLIGTTGYFIACCLFGMSFQYIDLDGFLYMLLPEGSEYNKEYPSLRENMLKVLRMYLSSNIQFYGQTLLDEILLGLPSISTEEKQIYGLLIYICYHKSIFRLYKDKLDILKDAIIEFVKDRQLPLKEYSWNMKNNAPKVIKDFLSYVTPSEGGRRRQFKKSRRVKRRKHNKTLKVRNG